MALQVFLKFSVRCLKEKGNFSPLAPTAEYISRLNLRRDQSCSWYPKIWFDGDIMSGTIPRFLISGNSQIIFRSKSSDYCDLKVVSVIDRCTLHRGSS